MKTLSTVVTSTCHAAFLASAEARGMTPEELLSLLVRSVVQPPKVKLADVAAAAGVSKGLASAVLGARSSVDGESGAVKMGSEYKKQIRVSAATADRIRKAAKKLGYAFPGRARS